MWMRLLILGLILQGAMALGAGESTVIQVKARLVPVAVTVTDRHGRPVTDLKAADFRIWDNGQPRQVAYFARETLTTEPVAAGTGSGFQPQATLGISRAGRRTFLILFGRGGVHDPFKFQDDLIHYVQKELLPGDRVAVMAYNRATDFTTDHERIVALLRRYQVESPRVEISLRAQSWGNALAALFGAELPESTRERIDRIFGVRGGTLSQVLKPPHRPDPVQPGSQEAAGPGIDPLVDPAVLHADPTRDGFVDPDMKLDPRGTVTLGSQLILTDPFDVARYDALTDLPFDQFIRETRIAQLDIQSLFAALMYLRYLEGPKYLLFFSDQGIYIPRGDVLKRLTRLANDAQVTLYTFQTGGVETPSTMMDNLVSMKSLNTRDEVYSLSSLRSLAEETGGQVSIHHGIADSIARMDGLTRTTYVIGYDPGTIQWDGSYHQIRVEVSRPKLRVAHRQGYFAREVTAPVNGEEFIAYTRIATAATLRKDLQEVDFKLEDGSGPQPGHPDRRWARLSINPDSLALRPVDGVLTSRIYLAVYYDADGEDDPVHTWHQLDVRLSPAELEQARQEGVRVTVSLPPSTGKALLAAIYVVNSDRLGSRST